MRGHGRLALRRELKRGPRVATASDVHVDRFLNVCPMHADRTSLIDLGMLPDATGAWPLGPWLDRTHSRPAHEALKRLVTESLADAATVRARQELLCALADVARVVPWVELNALAARAEQFLSSNYVLIPQAHVPRLLFAARYPEILTFVDERLRTVHALLALADTIHTRLAALPHDEAFASVVGAFHASVHDARRAQLRDAVAGGQKLSIAGLDVMVRGGDAIRADAADAAPLMRDVLLALLNAIVQLDAFCSIAVASAQLVGVLPDVNDRELGTLALGDLRHPLLSHGVSNDVALDDAERVLMLTGPNMAGKSTLLRAVGIAVYCAHLGMKVAARSARIPWHDEMLVSLTVRDNLQRGESLYLAEVRRVRTIVDAVDRGQSVFAIFDEVFRGTNISDATQATTLLVDGLARAEHGTFVIASHLADVAAARRDAQGVSCWCMEVDMLGDMPRFTYRMRPGVSAVHLGMILLDAEGVGPVLRRMAAR